MGVLTIRAGEAEVLIFSLIGDAPLNITYRDGIVLHRVRHAPTDKPKFAFFYLFEGYDRYNDPNKYKNGRILSEKNKKRKRRVLRLSCGSNMRFNFWIETRKNERGIAENPKFLVITCFYE